MYTLGAEAGLGMNCHLEQGQANFFLARADRKSKAGDLVL